MFRRSCLLVASSILLRNQRCVANRTMSTLLPGTEDWEATWAKGLDRGMRWDIGRPEPELTYELGLKDKGTLAACSRKNLPRFEGSCQVVDEDTL